MKPDCNGNEQGISLYTETGKRIETKGLWDRQLRPGDTFAITEGICCSLFLMTLDESKRYKEMLRTLSEETIFYNWLIDPPIPVVINVEIDRHGHLTIPDYFLKHAGIVENAVIKGSENFAQIWNEQDFNERAFVENVEKLRLWLLLESLMDNIGCF